MNYNKESTEKIEKVSAANYSKPWHFQDIYGHFPLKAWPTLS
jgi:hypothetical protein